MCLEPSRLDMPLGLSGPLLAAAEALGRIEFNAFTASSCYRSWISPIASHQPPSHGAETVSGCVRAIRACFSCRFVAAPLLPSVEHGLRREEEISRGAEPSPRLVALIAR